MPALRIDFQPVGRRGSGSAKESLLECARRCGVGLVSVCGGTGTCHTCKVQIIKGKVSPPTTVESEVFTAPELSTGWRLACQVFPRSNLTVHIPAESLSTPQRTQVEGLSVSVRPKPAVRSIAVKLAPLTLHDTRADSDRLLQALAEQHGWQGREFDFRLLQELSPKLRDLKWKCQAVVREHEVISITAAESPPLGLAVDIGTTKIAGYLLDLNSGRALASRGIMNPQISYGEDIISRIACAHQSLQKAAELQKAIVEAINTLATDLCHEIGTSKLQIVDSAMVGNTAMHHFLLGLPVEQLIAPPFLPAVSTALDVKAREIGIEFAPGAYIHLLPNIAGFVGADHTAMLLSTGAWKSRNLTIAIDIGTNTEVSLISEGKITAASCASGPAFEGGHIQDGMRAARGAIERLIIEGEKVRYQTIDDTPPVGICGSGALDALAQLHSAGIVDDSGKMSERNPRVRKNKGMLEFVLVSKEERESKSPIVLTQKDVRELQLAKAAIRTGIQSLLENSGCKEDEIQQVIIAGAFGSYINVSSAIEVGMLPALPLKRFKQVGNAAGSGARLALISTAKRKEAQRIASKVRYLELASVPGFMDTFIGAQQLGRYHMNQVKRNPV